MARVFATIDHLSGGRAVWNIVTSLNSNEAENVGVEFTDPAGRYDRADEFLEVVTGLWETWDRDALQMDRGTGVFADPTKVRELGFEGQWFRSRGPLTVPRPPQGWPLLLQAGQSGRGMRFAARWADLTFTSPRGRADAQTHYEAQRAAVTAEGRDPDTVAVLPAVMPIVAETREMAQAKEAYFQSLSDPTEQLIFMSEQTNFDFSQLPMDEPVKDEWVDVVTGSQGLMKSFIAGARSLFGPDATLRDLARARTIQSGVRFVGTAVDVADQMEEWFTGGACDGFAIMPTDVPGSFEDFTRLVVPELRRRGLPRTANSAGTLRERMEIAERSSSGA